MRGAHIRVLVRARDGWFLGMVQAALARPQPQPEVDCWKWRFAAVVIPPTAKSPERMAQKCAAGRDAVQTAEREEVVSEKGPPFHPFPQYDCDCVGATGEGASLQP